MVYLNTQTVFIKQLVSLESYRKHEHLDNPLSLTPIVFSNSIGSHFSHFTEEIKTHEEVYLSG